MDARYGLYIKKGDAPAVNTFTEWRIACCKVPFRTGGDVKDLPNRNWPDEHGDDTYMPARLMFQGYDAEFEMAYQGEELSTNPFNLSLAFAQMDAFKKWLTGNDTDGGSGTTLMIYSPYSAIGRQECYLKKISDEDPCVQTKSMGGGLYHENVVTFKVTFRVCDPMTNVTLADMGVTEDGE